MNTTLPANTTVRFGGIAVALALAFASATQAALIVDVQFNKTPGSGNNFSGAAVVGTAGDFWNNLGVSGTSVALNNTANVSSGLSLTWNSDSFGTPGAGSFQTTSYAKLMDGYIFKYTAGDDHIILSGLSASTGYTLYLYSQADSACTGRQLTVNVNGAGGVTTSPAVASANTLILGQNYLSLGVISDSSGQLDIAYRLGSGEANINGFQLAAVPEPVSTTLVVAG